MYGIERLTKQYILSCVSQQEIFEYYLNIQVEEQTLFKSPIRKDTHPTCSFKWHGNTLLYRDWAEHRTYNCFDLLSRIYHVEFTRVLGIIYEDMILEKKVPRQSIITENNSHTKDKRNIKVQTLTAFQPEVIDYLKSFHLTLQQVKKFKIIPISHVWLDDTIVWKYNPKDPAIAYYFGKAGENQRWKIYFFNRDNYRFMGNTNRINGWVQLPNNGELCVITKSLKDVACLDLFNIPAISMQNETTIPYDYIIEELRSRFTHIISLYDFDYTGIVNANKLKKLYNIPYVFLTNGRFNTTNYKAKDFSDYLRDFGIIETRKLINITYEMVT